jgi:hypothetical protein
MLKTADRAGPSASVRPIVPDRAPAGLGIEFLALTRTSSNRT